MRKIKRLGIFDSGLGGYTIYHDLKTHYPDLAMVLYADQKHAPYGNYSKEEIIVLAISAMQWFYDRGIVDVLLACNTVTSTALPVLRETFPSMRIWGIVDLTLNQIETAPTCLGVVATTATIRSHAYRDTFKTRFDVPVIEKAIPDLASAIEALEDASIIDAMVQESLVGMEACSHIVLGCTHYPLVAKHFEAHSKAVLLDSILPIRKFMEAMYAPSSDNPVIITTGDPLNLEKQIEMLYNIQEKVGVDL